MTLMENEDATKVTSSGTHRYKCNVMFVFTLVQPDEFLLVQAYCLRYLHRKPLVSFWTSCTVHGFAARLLCTWQQDRNSQSQAKP